MWRKRHNRPYSINLNLAKEKVFLMQKRKNLYCSTWFIQIIYELHLNEGFMNKYRTYHSFLPQKIVRGETSSCMTFTPTFTVRVYCLKYLWSEKKEGKVQTGFSLHISRIFSELSLWPHRLAPLPEQFTVLLSNIISLSGTRAAAKRRPSVTITYNQRHFTYNSHELLYDVWKDFFFPNVSPSQTN